MVGGEERWPTFARDFTHATAAVVASMRHLRVDVSVHHITPKAGVPSWHRLAHMSVGCYMTRKIIFLRKGAGG
jgi:hypothetical protein